MNILCVGDVVGSIGCDYLRKVLPGIKRQFNIDICIVNGENSADGNGITPVSAGHVFDSGADVITGGNHTFRRPEFFDELENNPLTIRPLNFPDSFAPGTGVCIVDKGRYQVAVINIQGTSFMENLRCPFDTVDKALEKLGNPKFCIVDFHAEATAEKKAFGYYLDGRVSAVFGTHTHIQTADAQIFENGTGYITDVGFTGPTHSVLGVKAEIAIKKFRSRMPARFDVAEGDCELNGIIFNIDEKTGKTLNATAIKK